MITSSFPDMGLGFEVASPDILQRPPKDLKRGIFSLEIMVDMLVYGLWIAGLCLASFVLVLYGFNDIEAGSRIPAVNCNNSYSEQCDAVFRARATCFACLTWFSLFLAWEMIDLRRSFFRMQPGSHRPWAQWMLDVWRNKFLFSAVVVGFVTLFPVLYIPVINHNVFRHEGISWEWAIVFIASFLFFIGVEAWKWGKRIFFRRREGKLGNAAKSTEDLEARVFGQYMRELTPASSQALSMEKRQTGLSAV